jgi:carbamate kinase
MRLLVALGGNALGSGQGPHGATGHPDVLTRTGVVLAALARHHRLVITHGNGPQVGHLSARQPDESLDVLDAQSSGSIGYALLGALAAAAPDLDLASLLTRVIVADVEATTARKPIGPRVDAAVRAGGERRGWRYDRAGDGWRRVVPSPDPIAIVELRAIEVLLAAGTTVIAAGGGGVPVVIDDGRLVGVEAVVDKDLTSSLLARDLGADGLVLLTDVDGVHVDHGAPTQRTLRSATVEELRAMALPEGSMGPKAEAACRFVEAGGAFAAIGALGDAVAIVEGQAGTRVTAAPATWDQVP